MKNCSRTKPFFKCLNCVQTLENKMYLKFTRQTEKKKKKENWINSSNERVVSIRFWSTFLRRVSRVQKKKKKKSALSRRTAPRSWPFRAPGTMGRTRTNSCCLRKNPRNALLSQHQSVVRLLYTRAVCPVRRNFFSTSRRGMQHRATPSGIDFEKFALSLRRTFPVSVGEN